MIVQEFKSHISTTNNGLSESEMTRMVSRLLIVLFLILFIGIPQAAGENVLLFRLKKLRNTFLDQLEQQVGSNDDLMEKQYLATAQEVADKIAQVVQETVETRENCGVQPRGIAAAPVTDTYMNECISQLTLDAESLSTYVVDGLEQFQLKRVDFSLWFMSDYFSGDWKEIYSSEHYNYVFDGLSNHVLQWDNVGSVDMIRFRSTAFERLDSLSAKIDECAAYNKSLRCR